MRSTGFREWLCAIVLPVLVCLASPGQNTASPPGPIATSTFEDNALGIKWAYPADWTIHSDTENSSTTSDQSRTLISLAVGQDAAISLVADNYQHVNGFSTKYQELLKEQMLKRGWEQLSNIGSSTVGGGLSLRTERFRSTKDPSEFLGLVVGPLRGYELKFVVKASSTDRLDEVLRSIGDMRVRPDWSVSGTPAYPDNPYGGKTVRISMGVAQGMRTKSVPPKYPSDARSRGVQGSVLMLVHLDTQGRVADIYVMEGDPLLASAAVESVSQWQYQPYVLNNEPVRVETQVLVNFTLH